MSAVSSLSDASEKTASLANESRYLQKVALAASVRINPPHVMTVFEGAAYLCVSPCKLRHLIWAGRIKHARIGSKIVLRRESLDDFIRVA
jgi:excisionase family DNA binding protein